MEWLFVVVMLAAAAGAVWWFADDYIQRPMSYWTRAQLEAAFKRHPKELARYVNRGTLSRKEWMAAVKQRQAEVDAELTRRGIKS